MNKFFIIFCIFLISGSIFANSEGGAVNRFDECKVNLENCSKEIKTALRGFTNKKNKLQQLHYAQLIKIESQLNSAISKKSPEELFLVMPLMVDFFKSVDRDNMSNELESAIDALSILNMPIYLIMSDYITEKNGVIGVDVLEKAIMLKTDRDFGCESSWEYVPIPIDGGGIIILNPTEVLNQLKMKPWIKCNRFLNRSTADKAFARYRPNGNGLPVLKKKFAANEKLCIEKWNELEQWVKANKPKDAN